MKNIFKYGLWIIGFVFFITIFLFSYFRIEMERSVLLDDLDRRARVIAKSLGPVSVRVVKKPPTPDEEDLAERLSGQGRTMGILVCGADGKLIARSAALENLAACEEPEIQEVLASGVEKILFVEKSGQTLHQLIYPLRNRDNLLMGTLSVVHEASYINKRVMTAVIWMAFAVAIIAFLISMATYFFSRRSFQKSVQDFLGWMKSSRETVDSPPPTGSLLKPVTREFEKMASKLRAAKETAQKVSEERQISDLWTSARLKAHAVTHLGRCQLIVVSNREPYSHTKEQGTTKVVLPASGLVTALDPVLRATSGLWVAQGTGDADREVSDSEGKVLVPPGGPTYTLKRVWLSREEEEGYYYGFSNEALWPLCQFTHYRPNFEEKDWAIYQEVNQKFSASVEAEFGKEPPCVLVQDYHFTLLPKFIREKRSNACIGLFWHIPWPMLDAFQICPWKREILEGMLGANFIGFHLQSYCNNFLEAVSSLFPARVDWDRAAIIHEKGITYVKPFPIGVQPWAEREIPTQQEFRRREGELRKELELRATRMIVSVDRLDYTKGIPERLGAVDRFFEKYPHFKEKVTFIQLGAPSRVHIPHYRDYITEVEKQTDHVNWKHATQNWKPAIFLKANHDPRTVYQFLRMADVCIVSSLSDGMNLVAKEFVAAREHGDGVLILSEFTGAAREFQEALQVNPYARADFAETIRIAFEMPALEQRRRMVRLKALVAENNVYKWAANLIGEMARAAQEAPNQTEGAVSKVRMVAER